MARYHEIKITVTSEENLKLVKELIHYYGYGGFVEQIGSELRDIDTPSDYRGVLLKYISGELPADKKKIIDEIRAFSAKNVEKISIDKLTMTAYLTPYEAIGEDPEVWNSSNYNFCFDLVWLFS